MDHILHDSDAVLLDRCNTERAELLNVCETCPESPYVQLQVPHDAERVRQIKFTITSHDQGWADDGPFGDPYAYSWTWFAVYVRKKGLRYNATIYQREVQRNVRGNGDFKTHVVLWKDNDENEDKADWMRALQGGDVIQLVPRAEYPAWVNVIQDAKIDLEYVPKHSQASHAEVPGTQGSDLVYQPLNPASRDIRILTVHPGRFEDNIRCTLSHLSLSATERPPFETLSYCWGDIARWSTISIEYQGRECSYPVSQSVEAAIRHLRYSDGSPRSIWIDLICIDQTNFEERAQQVALMTEIYSVSFQVNIWLGATSVAEQTAIKVVRDIYNIMHKTCPGGPECACTYTKHTLSLQEIEEHMKTGDTSTHGIMEGLVKPRHQKEFGNKVPWYMHSYLIIMSELFRNPWFRRVWVLQEVMNSSKAILRVGAETMPWEELVFVDTLPSAFHAPHLLPFYKLPPIWTSLGPVRNRHLFPVPGKNGEAERERQEEDILDVFLEALNMDASDPRDKLFALLNFGSQTKTLRDLPDLIKPDYTKPVDRVFADFTRWWIVENKSLRILSTLHGQCGRSWQMLSGPGGEPHTTLRPTWALGTEGRLEWAKITLAGLFDFHAAGNSTLNIDTVQHPPDGDPMKLHLSGVRIATIQAISHFPLHLYHEKVFEIYEKIFDPSGRYEHWKRGGRDDGAPVRMGSETPADSPQVMMNMQQHLREHWAYGERPLVPTIKKRSPASETEDTERNDNYEHMATNITFPCHGRCYFIASDGSEGLCPANARVGDIIVVFDGGVVPFLLREQGEGGERKGFELVGECYVDGKMNGEAMNGSAEIFALV